MENKVYVTRQPKRGKRSKITEEQKNLIVTDYNNGLTQMKLAAKYNLSQATICQLLKERSRNYEQR